MHRYPVNSIFKSIQGEGAWVGTQAAFLRLAGCSLHCEWCDTDYSTKEVLRVDEIVARLRDTGLKRVVITGGEPLLHDLTPIVEELFETYQFDMIEIETSGAAPLQLQTRRWHKVWITVSPKPANDYSIDFSVLHRARALKYVVTEDFDPHVIWRSAAAQHLPVFLQPCDYKDPERNKRMLQRTLELLRQNPSWRLSLQVHKILGLP